MRRAQSKTLVQYNEQTKEENTGRNKRNMSCNTISKTMVEKEETGLTNQARWYTLSDTDL